MLVFIIFLVIILEVYSLRTGTDIRLFTDEEKLELLKLHNDFRRIVGANNMRQLVWNTNLENMAQSWAENCKFEHNPNVSDKFGFRHIGENLFINSVKKYNTAHIVNYWHSEINGYIYENNTCTAQACGHYTQVVWAETHDIGCGVIWCVNITGVSIESGMLIICNYGPGGNSGHRLPYKTGGEPCSNCPVDAPLCIDNLCNVNESLTTTTSTPTKLSTPTSLAYVPSTTTVPATTMAETTTDFSTTTVPETTTDFSTTTVPEMTTYLSTTTSKTSPAVTKGQIPRSTEPVSGPDGLDLNTQLLQNLAIFGFVAATVSGCCLFQFVQRKVYKRKDSTRLLAHDEFRVI